MLLVTLFTVFESFLFPHTFFEEYHYNPAILYQEHIDITVCSDMRFGLPELQTYSIYSRLRSYSLSAASFGTDLYRENIISAGIGFPLTSSVATGIGISVLNYWIKDIENQVGYSLRIGGVFQHTPLTVGAWIHNVNVPKFSDVDYLPPCYSIRINYALSPRASFHVALRGIETTVPFLNFGLQYSPYTPLACRVGINTDPLFLEYGLTLTVGAFVIHYAGSNHYHLGLSHSFGLGFSL
jgi:hypothetical protein